MSDKAKVSVELNDVTHNKLNDQDEHKDYTRHTNKGNSIWYCRVGKYLNWCTFIS